MSSQIPQSVIDKVAAWMSFIIEPDQVVELRALGFDGDPYRVVRSGYFRGTELKEMAAEALQLSGSCQGVYYTINPVKPAKYCLQRPRVQPADQRGLTHDSDILSRRWILVDVDSTRDPEFSKCSASDEEKAHAAELAGKVREYLTAQGWPQPIYIDSGNGYHLLYRIENEPQPACSEDPIRACLRALSTKFDTSGATCDVSVYNPSRIVKFPGTKACKGPDTPIRPHRRCRVLEVPGVDLSTL